VRGHWDEFAVALYTLWRQGLGHGSQSITPSPAFLSPLFADDVIITCVRWYLRFKLSYRDLAELAKELGVRVAPSTILRWVVCYALEFEKCWQAYEQPVGDSWRVDETYLKVRGQWFYLYCAVDKQGETVGSYLSRTRDVTAAKAFFRKAFRRHGDPRVITLDGFEPTHAAERRMGMNNEFNYRWEDAVQIRTCPYLNNVVEQDHRRIKARVGPMLGFKRFFNARRVLAGIELVHKIIKGQFGLPESFGTDPLHVWYNVLAT
jgi:transposase-like protein